MFRFVSFVSTHTRITKFFDAILRLMSCIFGTFDDDIVAVLFGVEDLVLGGLGKMRSEVLFFDGAAWRLALVRVFLANSADDNLVAVFLLLLDRAVAVLSGM